MSSESSTGGGAARKESLALLIYGYNPSLAAAVVFSVLFGLVTLAGVLRCVRGGRTGLQVLVMLTALAECIGYLCRAEFAHSPTLGVYLIQDLVILLAPNALALVTYKVLGQLIAVQQAGQNDVACSRPSTCTVPCFMDSRTGLLRGSRVSMVFLISDAVAFLIQCGGGGIMASNTSNPSKMKLGENTMLGGLAIQLIFFGLFTVLAVVAYRRRHDTAQQQQQQATTCSPVGSPAIVDRVYHSLFVVIFLLTVRNLFRFVEFAQGNDGYAHTHEVFFYLFETLPILATFSVMLWTNIAAALHDSVTHFDLPSARSTLIGETA